jgi:hypothetical protein
MGRLGTATSNSGFHGPKQSRGEGEDERCRLPSRTPGHQPPNRGMLSWGPWFLFAVGILMILAAPAFDHQVNQDVCSWPVRASPCGW